MKNHPQIPRFTDTLNWISSISHLFSELQDLKSYDKFLARLADYEIKTKFSVTKNFKELRSGYFS